MRPDTVRQVVTCLTDPESSDLLQGEAHAEQVVQVKQQNATTTTQAKTT
jgi:hypothetical protein